MTTPKPPMMLNGFPVEESEELDDFQPPVFGDPAEAYRVRIPMMLSEDYVDGLVDRGYSGGMVFERFPRQGASHVNPVVSINGWGSICFNRPAAEISGLAPGDEVVILFDPVGKTVAIGPCERAEFGYRIQREGSGRLRIDCRRHARLMISDRPARFAYETIPVDGEPRPGFRLSSREGE